jgi:hypothetical protein
MQGRYQALRIFEKIFIALLSANYGIGAKGLSLSYAFYKKLHCVDSIFVEMFFVASSILLNRYKR